MANSIQPISEETREIHTGIRDMILDRDKTNGVKLIRDITAFLGEHKSVVKVS